MTETSVEVLADDERPFVLPTFFPPVRGVRGPDGRTTYRGETFGVIEGHRNLLLDLVVPPSDDPVPVVVWIHGGA